MNVSMHFRAAAILAALYFWNSIAFNAQAARVPPGFSHTEVTNALRFATAMEFAPDGRLFVCIQRGDLRVIKEGQLLPDPFLTVAVNSIGERGLLGIAFSPGFETNQFLYLFYTTTNLNGRVSRFTIDGEQVVPGSEVTIFDVLESAVNFHVGGGIHFGTDGKLYIGVGDVTDGRNAQMLTLPFGKLLRINPDGTIPEDNPFLDRTTGQNQAIWAMGLRNPFSFAVHPLSGAIFINDVGQDTVEEVSIGMAGGNYGWPFCEGPCAAPNTNFIEPIFHYFHQSSSPINGCSVNGGTFYVPAVPQFPLEYEGNYFVADFCGGWIRRLDARNGYAVNDFVFELQRPVDLKVGPDGFLYYVTHGGTLGKIGFERPSLAIERRKDQIMTAWSAGNEGFKLQTASSLATSNIWNDVTNEVVRRIGQLIMTNQVTGEQQFFRLVKE